MFGFSLRVYHVDYPVVGYHNWKSTHYLTEARNFAEDGFFENGFFVPSMDYPNINSDPNGTHWDTFPVISILVAIGFKIFGTNLIMARLIGILFSIGTILLMFLIIKKLTKNDYFALTTALLTAINPLFIFFSHNVQLVNVGIFFMLMSLYYYLLWIYDDSSKNFVLTVLFLILAFLTKYPFIIVIIPMLFIFPYKRIKEYKKYISSFLMSLPFILFALFWLVYSTYFVTGSASMVESGLLTTLINFSAIFSINFWSIMKSYIADNYTLLGIFFAGLGVLSLSIVKDKRETKLFFLGCFISIIPFLLIMGKKLEGHSYHQFPVAPFIIFFIAYAFITIATFLSSFTKTNKFKFIIKSATIILLFLLILSPSLEAKDRQFDTQFIGLDVAGSYIKANKQEGDSMVNSGHQDYGVLWHADMKGIKGVINSPLEVLQRAEKERNVQWLFLYQWGLKVTQEPDKWNYIQKNYELKQVAFTKSGDKSSLIYLVLKKGGSFNFSEMNQMMANKQIQSKDYEYTKGIQTLYYVNI